MLYHCTMCTRHPDLVSLDLYAFPVFPFEFESLLVIIMSNCFPTTNAQLCIIIEQDGIPANSHSCSRARIFSTAASWTHMVYTKTA